MSKNRKTKEKPEILAFERKLEPSDALLFSGDWEDRDDSSKWEPIGIQEKTVVGTVVHRLKPTEEDPAKLNLNEEKANIQTVHFAALPTEHDTVKVQFSLRVRQGFWEPSACNRTTYYQRIREIVDAYLMQHGLVELPRRYAFNLANGRFLWRNRISSEEIEVRIDSLRKGEPIQHWIFDAFSEPFRNMRLWNFESKELRELAEIIAKGLLGKEYVLLRVTAFARVDAGQEVFPSREFVQELGKKKKEKRARTKTLYQVRNVAALHSQKIGNALRTIDTWYLGAEENEAISIESYGSVASRGEAWRKSKNRQDFYTLFDDWILKGISPPIEQQHYVIAMLIRGGVFGEAKES